MSKQRKDPWPVWKISLLTIACIVLGIGLLWASVYAGPSAEQAPATAPASPAPDAPNPSPNTPPGFGMTHLLLLLALVMWATAAIFGGWLVFKLYMRIPAWRRRQLFGRAR